MRSLLYVPSCSSSTITTPDVRERRQHRQARPDDDVDVARPDPPPLVRALALAETRVEDGDARLEIRPEPVDEGHREGDLRDEDEGRPAAPERRGDGLDVDGGLAAAGHAVEEERRRVASLDRLVRRGDGLCLFRGQGRAGGTAATQPDRPGRERQSRPLPDVDLDEAAPDEAGDRPVAVPFRRSCCRDPGGLRVRRRGELGERGRLARTERPAGRFDRRSRGLQPRSGHPRSGGSSARTADPRRRPTGSSRA